MMKNIRIQSDGTAAGTYVFSASGEKITGITRIEIAAIEPGDLLVATITIFGVELDIAANVETA